jgi:gamma-glutamyltranspeptidase/glutathione hydrolase
MLRQGGSAVDAAIATQAALGVVYPHMTGLGGDAFWLVHDGYQVYGLNGSGRAAAAATPTAYTQRGFDTIPQRGPLAALTVPGAVDSWHQVHQRWGRLPWGDLLQPAIALATEGYPVTGSQAHWTRRDRDDLQVHGGQDNPFLIAGAVPPVGKRITNPALALTLTTLAEEGAATFYQGSLGARIGQHLAEQGGLLTTADLAAHESTWVSPLTTSYRGCDIYTLPPNSQGFTLLQALNVVEGFDLPALGHGTADYYHLMVEALKLACADRDRWLTDPSFAEIPLATLIDKAYGTQQRRRLQWDQAGHYTTPAIGGDTVYTAIVDRDAQAVSVIQSLYFDFGSTVVVPGTGFVLQNRGSFFSLDPDHINVLAPQKRTFHTLMPSLVLRQDRLAAVLGTMGGEGQPQTQLALLTRTLDFGLSPQAAIDAPRWLWGRTWGDAVTGLTLEERIPPEVQAELRSRGHDVKAAPPWSPVMGHAHMIQVDPTTGTLQGGCDPRSDGAIAPA